MIMKKYWKSLMIGTMCVTLFALGNMNVFAVETQKTEDIVCDKYVDEDEDGVCDNHGEHCKFADADEDGVCDNHGKSCNFTDADEDGVCDNAGQHEQKKCIRNKKATHSEKGNAAHSRNTAGHRPGNGHHGGRHRN